MSVTATPTRSTVPPGHGPSPDRTSGVTAIIVAIVFTAAFTLLGVTFDYPAVLDLGAPEILIRYAAADGATRVLWYVMMIVSLAFAPLAVLLGRSLATRVPGRPTLGQLTVVTGVLAGLVQAVGFARWTFAVPYLAGAYTDPAASPATKDAVIVVFEAMHRFVGGALGEHLGFLLTALWTIGISLLLAPGAPRLVAPIGILAAASLGTGVLEVTGATWPGLLVAGGYVLFAAWLVWVGALLALGRVPVGRRRLV